MRRASSEEISPLWTSLVTAAGSRSDGDPQPPPPPVTILIRSPLPTGLVGDRPSFTVFPPALMISREFTEPGSPPSIGHGGVIVRPKPQYTSARSARTRYSLTRPYPPRKRPAPTPPSTLKP